MSNYKIKHGWQPDLPDARDHKFSLSNVLISHTAALPKVVNLSTKFPEVFDQGQLGSCTANAISSLLTYKRKEKALLSEIYSRLFIYYNERAMENSISIDSGAMIRDGIKSINKQGACTEKDVPYNITKFRLKPSVLAYTKAKKNIIQAYQRLDNTNIVNLKKALASDNPFVFGFTVYESFESDIVAKTGIMPMPDFNNETVLGGHAVCAVGYDDSKKAVLVRNSWGTNWGLGGYFWMPYAYITDTNLCDDFWVINP